MKENLNIFLKRFNMDDKLENKLYEKFPALFVEKDLSSTKTGMCFGCQCGNGWYDLIDRFCQEIIDNDAAIPFFSVKQKFGRLLIYTSIINEPDDKEKRLRFHEIEGRYSLESSKTCEHCGSKKDVKMTGTWITPLCKKCR